MEPFPGNSNKSKEPKPPKPEKKVERVVKNDVVQKKRSLGGRFKEVFFGADARSVSAYIVVDVLLPAFRNMVVDATTKGVERMIYGDTSARRPSDRGRSRMAYNTPSDRSPFRAQQSSRPVIARTRRINDIILANREDADNVISMLSDLIDQYDFASVADLYDLVGIPTAFTDNNWGWTTPRYFEYQQTRDGYLMSFPPPEPA